MTIQVQVSCNGDYECPVHVKQGAREEEFILSGKGKNGPDERRIYYSHANAGEPMTVTVGPETYVGE